MKRYVYVKRVKFEELEQTIEAALAEVDKGKHDEALAAAGFHRPQGLALAGSAKLSQPQGLSPEEWSKLVVDFAPVVATIAGGVWTVILLPKLKKLFREDRISEVAPKKSKAKKKSR